MQNADCVDYHSVSHGGADDCTISHIQYKSFIHFFSHDVHSGLDAYFFPNLGVGQPSTNIDLSEIEIYLGMIISFYNEKQKFLLQD